MSSTTDLLNDLYKYQASMPVKQLINTSSRDFALISIIEKLSSIEHCRVGVICNDFKYVFNNIIKEVKCEYARYRNCEIEIKGDNLIKLLKPEIVFGEGRSFSHIIFYDKVKKEEFYFWLSRLRSVHIDKPEYYYLGNNVDAN